MNRFRDVVHAARTALRTFGLGTNLGSLRMIAHPLRMYYFCNASLFLRDTLAGFRGLSQRYVWEVFPEVAQDIQLQLPRLSAAWRWEDPSFAADLVTLALLCRAARPNRVFEIGTFKGYTALLFAANSESDPQVFTLDLPVGNNIATHGSLTVRDQMLVREGQAAQTCFATHSLAARITRLWGDSAVFDFSPYYDSIDFFFVDGAHTYDYVRRDTGNALRCVRPGGVIAWHDYGRSGLSAGVSRWLNELGRVCQVYCSPGSSVAFLAASAANLQRARQACGIAQAPAAVLETV